MLTYQGAPLQGRTALVTGAGRNIGRATAMALANAGADVVVNVKSDLDNGNRLAGEIQALGRRAIALAADVASNDEVTTMVELARDALGPITVLVCCAAERSMTYFPDISATEWDRAVGTSLSGAFFCARAVAPDMIEANFGRIVALSADDAAVPHHAHVAAAKYGLEGLMRGIVADLGAHGVTANVVGAGHVATDRTRSHSAATSSKIAARRAKIEDRLPMGRYVTPEEIADTCVFLCLPQSRSLTNLFLVANGGPLNEEA